MNQCVKSKNPTRAFKLEKLVCLPNLNLTESSEKAFGEAFLKAAHILHQQLEQINSALGVNKDSKQKPFNLAILGLFSKMCRHYYSYVLLEIHHDRIGSQLLLQQLYEAAITLTYLLEEEDKSFFKEYVCASVSQAHYLLIDVEEQLEKSPHPDLLILKAKLKTFITKHLQHTTNYPLTDAETYLWGAQEADTTAKRAAIIGLNFLTNPAQQIALKVKPASWLDLQLSYLNSFAKSSRIKAQPTINFTYLRDASHLCLHTTQSLLAEVVNHQDVKVADIELQQQPLNMLYEWFYEAHNVYQGSVTESKPKRVTRST